MRYVLEQKLLSWGDDYTIRDEQGADFAIRTASTSRAARTTFSFSRVPS